MKRSLQPWLPAAAERDRDALLHVLQLKSRSLSETARSHEWSAQRILDSIRRHPLQKDANRQLSQHSSCPDESVKRLAPVATPLPLPAAVDESASPSRDEGASPSKQLSVAPQSPVHQVSQHLSPDGKSAKRLAHAATSPPLPMTAGKPVQPTKDPKDDPPSDQFPVLVLRSCGSSRQLSGLSSVAESADSVPATRSSSPTTMVR